MKPNTNSLLQPPDQKIPRASMHLSAWMTVFLVAACGLLAANIYYAQPLVGLIGESLGLPRAATGLIVTMTQIGYGAGLLLIASARGLVREPPPDLVCARTMVIKKGRVYETSYKQ